MRPTVVQLRQFYSSRLGRRVTQRLRQSILEYWPEHTQETIIGIGYTPPLLRMVGRGGKSSAILALMPADQGAIYWPVHTDNRSVLGDEMMPPFSPNTLHRVLMVHLFEFLPQPLELLQVYWQMLAPGGRLIVVVPNRRGLWARFGKTPFGCGTPYSIAQLRELLEKAQFTLRECATALFAPPAVHPFWQRIGGVLEWLGGMLAPGMGGVIVAEAEKQIYAGLAVPTVAHRRQWAGGRTAVAAERRGGPLPNNRI